MSRNEDHQDTEFDLRTRAELALAYEPGQPPKYLFRKTPWLIRHGVKQIVALMVIAGIGSGGVLAMRPPELVRGHAFPGDPFANGVRIYAAMRCNLVH